VDDDPARAGEVAFTDRAQLMWSASGRNIRRMVSILGAGGAIGSELFKELSTRSEPIRLVSRNPKPVPGAAEVVAADLSNLDDTLRAVSGSRVAFLLVGLKYDAKVWRELWPRIMHNAIESCKRSNARLIFFDNVYMYGKVEGAMTEETPFHPNSKKGEIRAAIATTLLNEIKAGKLTALIARFADFYGPRVATSLPNKLVFDKFAKGAKAMWPGSDSVKHSFTFTPDAARSLVLLADTEGAWNQTWHVPTAPEPPTGKEFIALVAKEFGMTPKCRAITRPMLWVMGRFDTATRELYEMFYQYDYIFDSTKFMKAFSFQPTPYSDGIHRTAQAYLQ
jgi:nucleoside-diphosphate-sugar epimerase